MTEGNPEPRHVEDLRKLAAEAADLATLVADQLNWHDEELDAFAEWIAALGQDHPRLLTAASRSLRRISLDHAWCDNRPGAETVREGFVREYARAARERLAALARDELLLGPTPERRGEREALENLVADLDSTLGSPTPIASPVPKTTEPAKPVNVLAVPTKIDPVAAAGEKPTNALVVPRKIDSLAKEIVLVVEISQDGLQVVRLNGRAVNDYDDGKGPRPLALRSGGKKNAVAHAFQALRDHGRVPAERKLSEGNGGKASAVLHRYTGEVRLEPRDGGEWVLVPSEPGDTRPVRVAKELLKPQDLAAGESQANGATDSPARP